MHAPPPACDPETPFFNICVSWAGWGFSDALILRSPHISAADWGLFPTANCRRSLHLLLVFFDRLLDLSIPLRPTASRTGALVGTSGGFPGGSPPESTRSPRGPAWSPFRAEY